MRGETSKAILLTAMCLLAASGAVAGNPVEAIPTSWSMPGTAVQDGTWKPLYTANVGPSVPANSRGQAQRDAPPVGSNWYIVWSKVVYRAPPNQTGPIYYTVIKRIWIDCGASEFRVIRDIRYGKHDKLISDHSAIGPIKKMHYRTAASLGDLPLDDSMASDQASLICNYGDH